MVRLPFVALFVLVATLPAQVRADALQNRLVAGARATDTSGHAFRETITASGTGVGTGGKTYVTTYDPRRGPDDRWRLVSIDGRPPTKELQKSRKAKRDSVPTYADLAKWLGSAATRTEGPGGTVMYRYPRLPAGTLNSARTTPPPTPRRKCWSTRAEAPPMSNGSVSPPPRAFA